MKKRKRTGSSSLLYASNVFFEAGKTRPQPGGGPWRPLAAFLLCLSATVLAGPAVFARQKPAPVKTISGAVLTASNAGVAGASVILTDLETHSTDAIYSGANGKYNFSGVNPNDDYRVRATFKQLVSDTRNVSSLDSRSRIVINLVLRPPAQAASEGSQ